MCPFLRQWLVETWLITVEAAPWLLVGFLLAGIIHAWVPVGRVSLHLGGNTLAAVVKAAVLGIPLPLCSCSVIPLASSLRRNGASKGATAGFLISTPETGVDSIAITYALLGPVMALLRPLAALVSAVAAGAAINRFAPEEAKSPSGPPGSPTAQPASDCCPGACCGPAAPTAPLSAGPPARFRRGAVTALRYAGLDMFADLSLWLVIGLLLAGLISALVPDGFLEQRVGSGWLTMLLMLVIGLPFYVCATSSTPVVAALMAKGLSPGAALVFLLAGPATNLATMIVVGRELGRRSLLIYVLSIAVVAVGLGLLVDLTLARPASSLQIDVLVEEHHSWGAAASAVLLILLLAGGLYLRYGPRRHG